MNYYIVVDYIPQDERIKELDATFSNVKYLLAICLVAGDELSERKDIQRYRNHSLYLERIKTIAKKEYQPKYFDYADTHIRSEILDMWYHQDHIMSYGERIGRNIDTYDKAKEFAHNLMLCCNLSGFKDIIYVNYEHNNRLDNKLPI